MSSSNHQPPDVAIPLLPRTGASLREQVVAALIRVRLEAQDAFILTDGPDAEPLRWIEPHLQRVLDEVSFSASGRVDQMKC